jgi:hypothetical protein
MHVCVRVRRRDTAPDPRAHPAVAVYVITSSSTDYAFPRPVLVLWCFSGSAPPAAFVVPHPPQTRTV